MELDEMLAFIAALNAEGADYLVVGGVALNIHGIIRATEDVDVFIRPDTENVERVKRALARVWPDPEIESIRAEDLLGEYPTVRYGPPDEDFVIDLIARLGTAIAFEDLQAEIIEVDGVQIRVASPSSLYRMKAGTLRAIDHADATVLKERFDVGDG